MESLPGVGRDELAVTPVLCPGAPLLQAIDVDELHTTGALARREERVGLGVVFFFKADAAYLSVVGFLVTIVMFFDLLNRQCNLPRSWAHPNFLFFIRFIKLFLRKYSMRGHTTFDVGNAALNKICINTVQASLLFFLFDLAQRLHIIILHLKRDVLDCYSVSQL